MWPFRMNSPCGLRFLRPYLYRDIPIPRRAVYLRLFSTTKCVSSENAPLDEPNINLRQRPINIYLKGTKRKKTPSKVPISKSDQRLEKLKAANALEWPRIVQDKRAVTIEEFHRHYHGILRQSGAQSPDLVVIRGRITSIRIASSKLAFIDIIENGYTVQTIVNFSELGGLANIREKEFKTWVNLVRRGDFISLFGHPCKTTGYLEELSIRAKEMPIILSPALHVLPLEFEDPESRVRNRHVDMLVNQITSDTIRARSEVTQFIRNFLLNNQFIEVQTPIIADAAGGAIAKPFTTVATEFPEKQLALRIAPELWLKRMIMGGIDRVFEIGPVFRNEGLDGTHNPEFSTCEFYKAYASLDELITMTEEMISGIASHVSALRETRLDSLPIMDVSRFQRPFRRIEFIPAIEEGLGEKLPDLSSISATEQLVALFERFSITVPPSPTLPRLLDRLCGTYIESQCEEPTFIIHHPACMAPLSKSFLDKKTEQVVSARAELFIGKNEIANMYEEENSPYEQRTKFEQQTRFRDDENKAVIEESYLEAMEWGLPPTGGFGCGIDRLIMLFTGASRISDVLPFGSLKNVVNLGSPAPRVASSKSAPALRSDK